jgi:hypothetical protein
MFKFAFHRLVKATLFEKLLLIVGISIGVIGFWFINRVFYTEPIINWNFLTAVFLWMLLILMVILTDSNESIKEELSIIMKEHMEKTVLLREEVKLIGDQLKKIKKK